MGGNDPKFILMVFVAQFFITFKSGFTETVYLILFLLVLWYNSGQWVVILDISIQGFGRRSDIFMLSYHVMFIWGPTYIAMYYMCDY